ncbi:unnamed protein product [Ceratitis capitata]|uniref:(Mediterranean fruit fly) hypothetical protein n=1 Tax=Ceratitis capitata TaxID=7213 RepID=A0A811U696_CERCA|nr:unnamed protein product [Ceratitis capitata]
MKLAKRTNKFKLKRASTANDDDDDEEIEVRAKVKAASSLVSIQAQTERAAGDHIDYKLKSRRESRHGWSWFELN